MDDELRITIADCNAVHMCSRGVVAKLRTVGYDATEIRAILRNGMPISEARAIGDAQFDKVISHKLSKELE